MTGEHNLTQLHLDTALGQCQAYILLNSTLQSEHPDVSTLVINLCPNNCSNRGVCSEGRLNSIGLFLWNADKINIKKNVMFKTCFYRELHMWQWIWRKWLFLWRFIPTYDNRVIRQWSLWQVHGNLWWYNTVWTLLRRKHGNNLLCYKRRCMISFFVILKNLWKNISFIRI